MIRQIVRKCAYRLPNLFWGVSRPCFLALCSVRLQVIQQHHKLFIAQSFHF